MVFNELMQRGTEDFPFELYRVDYYHPRYEMALHWHGDLEMIRVLKGELTVVLNQRSTKLCAGDVAFVNSESVHGATPSRCEYECIVYDLSFLKTGNRRCDDFIEGLLSGEIFLWERPEDSSVIACAHDVFDALGAEGDGREFKVLSTYCRLFGEILESGNYEIRTPVAAGKDERKILKLKTVLQFMREHFAEPVSLDQIARVSGYSEKYFCKFFKEMTGVTPVGYLTAYRIERAAQKLLITDAPVTQIAYDCGFNDLSYFIKTFKSQKSVSPNRYRKK